MEMIYIIFTVCICLITIFKILNEDSESVILILFVIALFVIGMEMFPQLFSEI